MTTIKIRWFEYPSGSACQSAPTKLFFKITNSAMTNGHKTVQGPGNRTQFGGSKPQKNVAPASNLLKILNDVGDVPAFRATIDCSIPTGWIVKTLSSELGTPHPLCAPKISYKIYP